MCGLCWSSLPAILSPYCRRCGLPLPRPFPSGRCGACLADRRWRFRRARALGRYEGVLKASLLELKYRERARVAVTLGRLAFEAAIRRKGLDVGDAVIPVPLHWRRRRERGYNQAELLAAAVAGLAGRPVRRALKKVRHGPPQATLTGGARWRNAAGAYRARVPRRLVGKHVLLIDDVFTTGATVEACVRALLRGGAGSVDVLTMARVLR